MGWGGKLAAAARDIKLAHSVFALPFAVLAAVLVAPVLGPPAGNVWTAAEYAHARAGLDGPVNWFSLLARGGLVVVCMVAARTFAMLVNRVADRQLDAANPRTARRAFAAGTLSASDGLVLLAGSAAVFVACCAMFGAAFNNWWPLVLSPVLLAWLAFYSFTKRFTPLCHLVLGGALALSPIAAAIAVRPQAIEAMPAVWWLAGMVLVWVAGFDVIYALQDLEHDQSVGINSLPALLGWRGAVWVSRLLHLTAAVCLVAAWLSDARFGVLFAGGAVVTIALLVWEHAVLARRGAAGIPMAFFTANGVVSVVLGAAGAIDVFV